MPTVSSLQPCLLLAENICLMLHGVFDIRDNFGLFTPVEAANACKVALAASALAELRVTVPSWLPQAISTLLALPYARAVEALWI